MQKRAPEKFVIEDGEAGKKRREAEETGEGEKKGGVLGYLMVIARVLVALGLLYVFICSLDLLSASFRLLGGKAAGEIFGSPLLRNPVVGMVIGILVTVLVQSSSTSTSLVVSMVTAGYLEVQQAIPMLMGANVGTSITNTLVSFSQVGDREEFRRAFAAATVHDMFNWLTVIVLLPIEVITHMLYHISYGLTNSLATDANSTTTKEIELLKVITDPLTKRVVQLDSKVLEAWSLGDVNNQYYNYTSLLKNCSKKCDPETYLFFDTGMDDTATGGILLAISLVMMSGCLILLVKVLNSILQGQISSSVNRVINMEFAYPFSWAPGYIAIALGAIMTFLVQSSSVFTSALTPLAGMGLVTLDRMYPLCLGSNVGTTSTAVLAALAAGPDHIRDSLQAALCHMLFNLFGIMLFYVVPAMRWPVGLAQMLGDITAEYRWFAVAYLVIMFLMFPLCVFALSQGGEVVFLAVLVPCLVLAVVVVLVNVVKRRRPQWLPEPLRSHGWRFLPRPLRSLRFYDEIVVQAKCWRKRMGKGEASSSDALEAGNNDSGGAGAATRDQSGTFAVTAAGVDNAAFDEDGIIIISNKNS
ncbi:unnamed protein product [Notodromas monacha]|uniref:Sodium-dependent phosphate transport protein 2B n=1 Tax=Notodromas monacha TaxID=399045 RepID=A0A7R9GI72_9CRUS|nr:unnamed protein product [Notodromas monacha]CAG0922126.1 unnamed protein product [Notodromas monacha]